MGRRPAPLGGSPIRPGLAPHPTFGRRVLTFMGFDALKAINAKPRVYYPLFGALALSAVDSFGLAFWRTPFMVRTYGGNEAQVGMALGPIMLVGSIAGLFALVFRLMIEFESLLHVRTRKNFVEPHFISI